MLTRRQFAQLSLAGLGASLAPWSLAKTTKAPVLWGPPVAPTLLLAIAAKDAALQKAYPGVRAQTWRSPDALRAGLTNHSMPLTMVPSYVAANFRAHKQDVGLLNIMTFGLLYVIGKNEQVKTLGDLVGKTLVMPFRQDMPDLVLQALLKKAGIPRDKINIQYTSTPPEALLLFLSGRADLALLPEPAVSMAQIKAKNLGIQVRRNLDVQKLWGELMGGNPHVPQAGILVTRAFYEQHAAFLAALNAPLERALSLAKRDPQAAAAAGAGVLKVPTPVMAASIPHANLTVTPAQKIEEDILRFFEVLYRLNPKIVGGKMPDAGLFWKLPQA